MCYESERIPASVCRVCGYRVDMATAVDAPRVDPGDISICFRCGHIAVFAEDLSLRGLTPEERAEYAGDPGWLRVLDIQREIRSRGKYAEIARKN